MVKSLALFFLLIGFKVKSIFILFGVCFSLSSLKLPSFKFLNRMKDDFL